MDIGGLTEWIVLARTEEGKQTVMEYARQKEYACHAIGRLLILRGKVPEIVRQEWEKYDVTMHEPKGRQAL